MAHKKRLVSLLLLAAMLATAACGDNADKGNETTASGGTTVSSDDGGYAYPDKNYGGEELNFMNYATMWECNMAIDCTEQSGDRLENVIYNRNRKVEEKLGITIVEHAIEYPGWSGITESIDSLMQSIASGDHTYDVAYIPLAFKPGLITEKYLYNLYDLPGMNLDSEWWDQNMINSLTINGNLYAATSPLHLMSIDMSWVILFNQDMMEDLKLELPYQTVKDGNWTLDKFAEYVKASVSLNGDDGFQPFSAEGNSVYGIAHHPTAIEGFMYAAGNRLVVEENGNYSINLENEHFYNTLDKLYALFDKTNGNREGNSDVNADNSYYGMFRENRAMFLTCELKTTGVMRDLNQTFGLLPCPKYDESQEEYYTLMNANSCVLTVPQDVRNPEMVGYALDALSYESLQTVIPEYYDVSLSQKGLRNEESIEMLQIIRESRGIEFSRILGVTNDIVSKLSNLQNSTDKSYASTIASNKNAVAENLEKLLDAMD